MKIEQMTDLTLPLWGKKLSYSSEQTTFFMLERMFRLIANRAQEHYVELYLAENKNLNDVFKKGKEQGDKVIVAALTFWAELLIESGYYDINASELISLYNKTNAYSNWERAYDKIAEKYIALELSKEQQEAYRKARKNSRGRLVGGGFGVAGAAKGIATAGVFNLATGAVHGTVNMVGNAVTKSIVSSRKSKVFSDDATLEELATGIYQAVYHARNAILSYLHSTSTIAFAPISEKAERECATRLSNYKKIDFSEEKLKDELLYLLNLDPFNIDVYIYALNQFGDVNSELEHITELFWLTDSFREYRFNKISAYAQETVYINDYKGWITDSVEYAKKLGASFTDDEQVKEISAMLNSVLMKKWKKEIDTEVYKIQSKYDTRDIEQLISLESYSNERLDIYGIRDEEIMELFIDMINSKKVFLINEAMKNAPMDTFEQYKESKKIFEEMVNVAGLHRTDSNFSAIQNRLDNSIESLVKKSLQKIQGERKGFFGTGDYKVLPPQTLEDWTNIYNEIESLNLKDNAPQIFAKYAVEICELEKATRTVNGVEYTNIEDAKQKENDRLFVDDLILNMIRSEVDSFTVDYYEKKGDRKYLISLIKNGSKFDSAISEIEKLDIDNNIKQTKIEEIKQQKNALKEKKAREKSYREMYKKDKEERFKQLLISIVVTLILFCIDVIPSWIKIIAIIVVIGVGASYKEELDGFKRATKAYEEITGVDE